MAVSVYPCRNVCFFVFVIALRPCSCRRRPICSLLKRNAVDGDWLHRYAFTLTLFLNTRQYPWAPYALPFQETEAFGPLRNISGTSTTQTTRESEHFNKQKTKTEKKAKARESRRMGQTPGERMWWAYIRVRLQQPNWPIPFFVLFPLALIPSSLVAPPFSFSFAFLFFFSGSLMDVSKEVRERESGDNLDIIGHLHFFVCFALLFIQRSRMPFLSSFFLSQFLPSFTPLLLLQQNTTIK